MFEWFSLLDAKYQITLIATVVASISSAIVTQCVIFLKERKFFNLAKKEKADEKIDLLFQKYASPLALSSTQLLWRLNEILNVQGRSNYLQKNCKQTAFNQYKKISTLYLLASFLGWLRAISKETSILRFHKEANFKQFVDIVDYIQQYLADGQDVEKYIFDNLFACFNLAVSPPTNREAIEVKLSNEAYNFCHDKEIEYPHELDNTQRLELAENLISILKSELPDISVNSFQNPNQQGLSNLLSTRSVLFYREWQKSLGEIMLCKSDVNDRAFDILSYKDFEIIYQTENDPRRIWLIRLEKLIVDLNPFDQNIHDDRNRLFRNVMISVAKLILVLNQSLEKYSVFNKATIELSTKLSAQEIELL